MLPFWTKLASAPPPPPPSRHGLTGPISNMNRFCLEANYKLTIWSLIAFIFPSLRLHFHHTPLWTGSLLLGCHDNTNFSPSAPAHCLWQKVCWCWGRGIGITHLYVGHVLLGSHIEALPLCLSCTPWQSHWSSAFMFVMYSLAVPVKQCLSVSRVLLGSPSEAVPLC